MTMPAGRAVAFDLLEGLLTENVVVLDRAHRAMEQDPALVKAALASMSALLCSALINVHGEVGALAVVDRARAEHVERAT